MQGLSEAEPVRKKKKVTDNRRRRMLDVYAEALETMVRADPSIKPRFGYEKLKEHFRLGSNDPIESDFRSNDSIRQKISYLKRTL